MECSTHRFLPHAPRVEFVQQCPVSWLRKRDLVIEGSLTIPVRRQILSYERCESCGAENKDVLHVLIWRCASTCDTWKEGRDFNITQRMNVTDFVDVADLILERHKSFRTGLPLT
ncbi:hypothetical protein FCV25MIE_15491 [Fagus crenata]